MAADAVVDENTGFVGSHIEGVDGMDMKEMIAGLTAAAAGKVGAEVAVDRMLVQEKL
jgi:hypothetical protein